MGGRLTIRDDLGAACARAWQRIARCGTWWNGAQRIAIAAETRNALQCGLCRERNAALSPFATMGVHDGGGELPGPVVEVVHRVRTDSGRLTRAWYEGVLASGLSDAQYVEIVGVVATTSALDTFSRGIGVAPTPLPPPRPGEPTRHRPARAKPGIAWVPTLELSDVADADPDPYPGKSAAEVFNIHRALSLVPEEAAGVLRSGRCALPPAGRDSRLQPRVPVDQPCPDRAPGRPGLGHQPVPLLNGEPCGAAP